MNDPGDWRKRKQGSLEIEVAVDAPEAADGVVEDAVIGRGEVLLDVARVVVVGEGDDFEAAEELDAMSFELEVEGILDFQVEASEGGKTSRFVALADEVPVGADVGGGETGGGVEDGNELKFVGQADDSPEENAVGRVARERAVLIRADEREGKIAEELVVVVEFAASVGAHVAAHDGGALGGIPAEHGEEFVVGLVAGVEELELGGGGVDRVDEEFAVSGAVLVAQ